MVQYAHDIMDRVTNISWRTALGASLGGFAYEYDALGRRVSTTTVKGTTRHVYDNNWQVVADIDENGDVVASYTWGEGIDKLLAVTIGGATYYPLTDIQGTVWGYVDSQNNIVICRRACQTPLSLPRPRMVGDDRSHQLPHAVVRRGDGKMALQGSN